MNLNFPTSINNVSGKILGCVLVLFCCVPQLHSQELSAELYSKEISPDSLYKSVHVLASDSMQGRETGKPGQKKAADFIARGFEHSGLKPASHGNYLQDHSLSLSVNKGMNTEVSQEFFLFLKDYYYEAGYPDTLLILDSLIFAGYGISDPRYDDYKNLDVTGKALMFYDGEPRKRKKRYQISGNSSPSVWSKDWKKKLEIIYQKKPRIVFIISQDLESLIDSLNYGKGPEEYYRLIHSPATIPIVFITPEMATRFFPENHEEMLEQAFRQINRNGKPVSIVTRTDAKIKLASNTNSMKGQNVVACIEGTDKKNEYLFITAHYDHLGFNDSLIYYGADDNASGTSGVLELARVFAKAAREGHPPRRTIVFMTVSGEEKGLLGSGYYVDHPLFPLSQTVADLNTDMIGRTDEKHDSLGVRDYIYVIGSDKLSTELHQINEKMNERFVKLQLDYQYNAPGDPNRFYFRSDHYNFAKHNIPVIFYFNGVHKDYHKPTDTAEKIDTKLMANRLRLTFLTAWELANRENRIRTDVKNNMEKKNDKHN